MYENGFNVVYCNVLISLRVLPILVIRAWNFLSTHALVGTKSP